MDLSAPYNWCDGQCPRCPLEGTCQLAKRLAGSRWQHEMRGEDPDDWDVVLADGKDELRRALAVLEDVAREDGVDVTLPQEPSPSSLIAKRVKEAGFRYAERVAALHPAPDDEHAAVLRSCALLTAAKCARLAGHLDLGQAVDADFDVMPNRMLVEHYDEQARLALELLAPRHSAHVLAQLESSRREIASLLDLAFGPIPEEVRAAFERMKAEGCAPSPFCVRAI